jgi:tyrosinase
MKECCFFPTANHVSITRFTSETVSVRLNVLETFRKAEVRLHRVQRGNMPNASIRVFLNAPKADAKTSLDSSKGYAGQVTTFHTYCYGGPGHCDLPLPRSRRFDQRPLHHHEPRNFRIDVSETVRDIVGKRKDGTGTDETIDISVQLVVVGIDGQLIDNALFIDGVSLNFMD